MGILFLTFLFTIINSIQPYKQITTKNKRNYEKELFKILANKVANQESLPVLIEVITESNVFCEEELDNVISLLLGVYKLPTIKNK